MESFGLRGGQKALDYKEEGLLGGSRMKQVELLHSEPVANLGDAFWWTISSKASSGPRGTSATASSAIRRPHH